MAPKTAAAPAPALATLRRIAQGEVLGLIGENRAHVWRGLPYAASTTGDNRWRAPRPAPAWEGRREALEFAERCVQLTTRADEDEGLEPDRLVGSEDCLALDIYAPAHAAGQALPVMVWIHGGYNDGHRHDIGRCACGISRVSPSSAVAQRPILATSTLARSLVSTVSTGPIAMAAVRGRARRVRVRTMHRGDLDGGCRRAPCSASRGSPRVHGTRTRRRGRCVRGAGQSPRHRVGRAQHAAARTCP